jgi:hypothetical protein
MHTHCPAPFFVRQMPKHATNPDLRREFTYLDMSIRTNAMIPVWLSHKAKETLDVAHGHAGNKLLFDFSVSKQAHAGLF